MDEAIRTARQKIVEVGGKLKTQIIESYHLFSVFLPPQINFDKYFHSLIRITRIFSVVLAVSVWQGTEVEK